MSLPAVCRFESENLRPPHVIYQVKLKPLGESAVSTGVDSERPAPNRLMPRERMLHAAFQSLSAVKPHDGLECSRTHSGLSVETRYAAHSFVVPIASTATKYVPSRSPSSRRRYAHAGPAANVSIPYWVSPSSRQPAVAHGRRRPPVSIPYWVSPSSRPVRRRFLDTTHPRFNPVLGFSLVATIRPSNAHRSRYCFNPVLGFSLVATCADVVDVDGTAFQSRTGFLPRRDGLGGPLGMTTVEVSIPYWVSPSSRPDTDEV